MIDTNHFKAKLLQEKDTLMDNLKGLGRVIDPITGDWEVASQNDTAEPDPNDMADRFEDFEEKSSELNALEKRLTDVNDALKKIEDGKYGTCEISGEEIEQDRLEANPAARTCKEHLNS